MTEFVTRSDSRSGGNDLSIRREMSRMSDASAFMGTDPKHPKDCLTGGDPAERPAASCAPESP